MTIIQKYSFLIALLLLLLNIKNIDAQGISFRASAPSAVSKGETFRLIYILRNGEGTDLKVPSSIKGFNILFGPAESSSSSTQIINGNVTSSSSVSYIYTLQAESEGTYSIPAATITVNGKGYVSNALTIKVLPEDKTRKNNQSGGTSDNSRQNAAPATSTAQKVDNSDAFIRAIVSKTRIKEQEAFMITFRFYTTLTIRDIGKIEFPEFDGFMAEDEDLSSTRQLTLDHYNGRNYYATDLKKTLLFPQRSGEITIPQGKIEMVFSVRSGRSVETLFGPQAVMTDVKRTLTTQPVKINVSPLPEGKPANFSNGVGSFSISSSVSTNKIKANEAVTLKLSISGTGNMKLIKTPELKLPQGFEAYDPKITNNLKLTNDGLSGTKTIEYLFIPRYEGDYKIPSIEFSYFDLKSNSYKTLSTPEYDLQVDKDLNANRNVATSFNQKDVKAEQDIRHIKTDQPKFVKTKDYLFGSSAYYLCYLIPTLLFIISFILYKQKVSEKSDVVRLRKKTANKVAEKRLKEAQKYLQENKSEEFYEELLRAVWGYLSNKLAIPMAQLNRDNIETELEKFGADKSLSYSFLKILDTCEFARYAPVSSDVEMDNLYYKAVDAIGDMEKITKQKV